MSSTPAVDCFLLVFVLGRIAHIPMISVDPWLELLTYREPVFRTVVVLQRFIYGFDSVNGAGQIVGAHRVDAPLDVPLRCSKPTTAPPRRVSGSWPKSQGLSGEGERGRVPDGPSAIGMSGVASGEGADGGTRLAPTPTAPTRTSYSLFWPAQTAVDDLASRGAATT